MLEYLDTLMKRREYEQALAYAERLLVSRENSPMDLLVIHRAMLTARIWLNQYSGALVIAETARKLAWTLQEWDHFGGVCWDLGAAHYQLLQMDQAIEAWLAYLSMAPKYHEAAKYDVNVKYNLGMAFSAQGDFAQASRAFTQAIEAARQRRDDRWAHGARHALIGALLKAGMLEQVPRLLAMCQQYLRSNPDALEVHQSRLWHMKLRVEYALATKRLSRARLLALRAIGLCDNDVEHAFVFHMLLARIWQQMQCPKDTLGHAVAARIYALRGERHDLQTEAVKLIYEVTNTWPEPVGDRDPYTLLDSTLPV